MLEGGLVIAALMTAPDLGRVQDARGAPVVAAMIMRDFDLYCSSERPVEVVSAQLEADGWYAGRRDEQGVQIFYAPSDRSRDEGGWVELGSVEGRMKCSVTGLLGSPETTDLLAESLAAVAGSVETPAEGPWRDCRRFALPERHVQVCSHNIQPHGFLSSIEASYFARATTSENTASN